MTVVAAFASSHAALMITRKAAVDPELWNDLHATFRRMADRLVEADVDTLVVFGTDHGRRFPLDHVPAFTIGVGPTATGMGDGGLPVVEFPVDQTLAADMLTGAIEEEIDLAFSEEVRIDHSFVTPLLLAFGDDRPTIVPVTQNCGIPPQPRLTRSYRVGEVLGQVAQRAGQRVAVLGTGGLSHWVGSDERRQFMRRRAGTRLPDIASYPVEVGSEGPVNEDFDSTFLALGGEGRWSDVLGWTTDEIESRGGNGAQEIRNWVAAAGFAGGASLEPWFYAAVPEWLTGTAIAEFAVSV